MSAPRPDLHEMAFLGLTVIALVLAAWVYFGGPMLDWYQHLDAGQQHLLQGRTYIALTIIFLLAFGLAFASALNGRPRVAVAGDFFLTECAGTPEGCEWRCPKCDAKAVVRGVCSDLLVGVKCGCGTEMVQP